jgi:hypothetical protein
MARQVYNRHRYTVDELYLAVDLYNEAALQFTLDNQPFGLKELNGLMAAYRSERIRVMGGVEPQQDKQPPTDDEIREIRRGIYEDIKLAMANGERDKTYVMHIWNIAFSYLVDIGARQLTDLDRYRDEAQVEIKRETLYDVGALFRKAIKVDVSDYCARLAVEAYIREVTR